LVEVADDVHEHEGEYLRCGGEFEWAGVERLHADVTSELLDSEVAAITPKRRYVVPCLRPEPRERAADGPAA